MILSLLTVIALMTTIVSAHFRLLYPEPRGVFVADKEPNFCGGYTDAVNNRSIFPLSDGFFTIKSGHPNWTAGVMISSAQNPASFDKFSSNGVQQLVHQYAKENNAGTFCIPLNISAANIAGVKDGANVTIQIVFIGGDGNLYQCADLTLSRNFTVPSSISCQNETTHSPTASGAAPLQTASALKIGHVTAGYVAAIFSVIGVVAALHI